MKDEVIKASLDHVPFIIEAVRQADMNECWAIGSLPVSEALTTSLKVSDYAKTWIVNGLPAALGGIHESNNAGIIWMVGTDLIDIYPRRFLARAYLEFERAQDKFDLLYNYIDVRNKKAIRWLLWMGFNLFEPIPYGLFKKPFHRFEWRKHDS